MVEHVHRNRLSPSGAGGLGDVRTQLHQEQTGLATLGSPLGDFGQAPNLLKQFHYFHFRGHNFHSRNHDRSSRAMERDGLLKR